MGCIVPAGRLPYCRSQQAWQVGSFCQLRSWAVWRWWRRRDRTLRGRRHVLVQETSRCPHRVSRTWLFGFGGHRARANWHRLSLDERKQEIAFPDTLERWVFSHTIGRRVLPPSLRASLFFSPSRFPLRLFRLRRVRFGARLSNWEFSRKKPLARSPAGSGFNWKLTRRESRRVVCLLQLRQVPAIPTWTHRPVPVAMASSMRNRFPSNFGPAGRLPANLHF